MKLMYLLPIFIRLSKRVNEMGNRLARWVEAEQWLWKSLLRAYLCQVLFHRMKRLYELYYLTTHALDPCHTIAKLEPIKQMGVASFELCKDALGESLICDKSKKEESK